MNNFSVKFYVLVLIAAVIAQGLTAARIGYFYALDADLKALRYVSETWIQKRITGATVTEFRIAGYDGVAIKMGSGSVQTAMSAALLLSAYPLDLAISVGPAGNLVDLGIGDKVRVSTGVAFQKSGEQQFALPSPPMGLGSLEDMTGVTLASGEAFINRTSRRDGLAEDFGAAAVDMNLFGLVHVLDHFQVPSVHLRVISDHADERARDDFLDFVETYEGSLARAVIAFLETLEPDPTSPDTYDALKELGKE